METYIVYLNIVITVLSVLALVTFPFVLERYLLSIDKKKPLAILAIQLFVFALGLLIGGMDGNQSPYLMVSATSCVFLFPALPLAIHMLQTSKKETKARILYYFVFELTTFMIYIGYFF